MRRPSSWEALRTSDLATIAPAELAGAVAAFMEAHGKPVSDKARVQCASHWRLWKHFAGRHGVAAFPLSIAALRAYKLECDVRGLRYETVGRYRQTLADIHDMMGVAFIWSATDVAGPLGADLRGGRSAIPLHEAEPAVQKPRPHRRVKRIVPRSETGQKDGALPVGGGNHSPPEARPQDGDPRPTPDASNVDLRSIRSLVGPLSDCHLLTRTLSHIITSGEERRVDEVIQLGKVLKYAGHVATWLEPLVPAPFRENLTTRVAPVDLASVARQMRSRLTDFMADGLPKSLQQVEIVGNALTQLCARDVGTLERIYPAPPPAANRDDPAAGDTPEQTGDVAQRATRLRVQLNQIALEIEQLKTLTARYIPSESSTTSRSHTATATKGTTR